MKEGLYKVVEGNQIPCKSGRYKLQFFSELYGNDERVIFTQRGGFNVCLSEEGHYRFFEEAEITVTENGFYMESEMESLQVTFLDDLHRITLPPSVGEFSISDFHGVIEFPESIQVIQDLSLEGILFFGSLPKAVDSMGSVTISDTPITYIPEDWHIRRHANFSDNTRLKEVKTKHFYGNLSLENCVNLQALPMGLHVRGNLNLEGCWKLKRLPKDLKVDGDLVLRGTNGIKLPPTIQVGGKIIRH